MRTWMRACVGAHVQLFVAPVSIRAISLADVVSLADVAVAWTSAKGKKMPTRVTNREAQVSNQQDGVDCDELTTHVDMILYVY